jgi:hypothetical protein
MPAAAAVGLAFAAIVTSTALAQRFPPLPPPQETSATDLYAELTPTGYILYGQLGATSTCASVRFTKLVPPSPPPHGLPPARAIVYRAEQFVALRHKTCVAKKQLIPVFMAVQDGQPKSLVVVSTNFPHGVVVPVQPIL